MLNDTAQLTNSTVNHQCRMKTSGENIAYAIFIIIVMVLTVIGNTFVCLTILVCRQLRRQITNYFVLFLAISDIAVGLFVFPFRIFLALHNQAFCAGIGLCVFYVLLDTTSSIASVTNLLVIALDRHFVIGCPYRYPTLMSRKKAIGICIGIWVYSHLWSWSSAFTWDKNFSFSISAANGRCTNNNKNFYIPFVILIYFIPLTIMGIVYANIWRIARKQARCIARYQIRSEEKSHRRRAREQKATATLAIIYGAFVICWLPNCVLGLASVLAPAYFRRLNEENKELFMFLLKTFVQVLPPLNSTMNPFIYAIHNQQFRKAFKDFLTKRKAALLQDSENGETRITLHRRSTKVDFKSNKSRKSERNLQNGETNLLQREAQF